MLRRVEIGDCLTDGVGTGRVAAIRRRGYPEPIYGIAERLPGTATMRLRWTAASNCAVTHRFGFVRRLVYGSCDEECV